MMIITIIVTLKAMEQTMMTKAKQWKAPNSSPKIITAYKFCTKSNLSHFFIAYFNNIIVFIRNFSARQNDEITPQHKPIWRAVAHFTIYHCAFRHTCHSHTLLQNPTTEKEPNSNFTVQMGNRRRKVDRERKRGRKRDWASELCGWMIEAQVYLIRLRVDIPRQSNA